jgi:hypothetical protein
MPNRVAVRVERELLFVDRDDDAEHAIGLGGEVLTLVDFGWGFVVG